MLAPALPGGIIGRMEFIRSISASAQLNIDITDVFTSVHRAYLITYELSIDTDDSNIFFSTSSDNGSTFDSTSGDYIYGRENIFADGVLTLGGSSTTTLGFAMVGTGLAGEGLGNVAGEGSSGRIWLHDPLNANMKTRVWFDAEYIPATRICSVAWGGGYRDSVGIVNALRIHSTTTETLTGEIRVYGTRRNM